MRKGAEKLAKYLHTKQQGRLDGFFTVAPKTSPKKGDSKDAKTKGKGKGADTKGTKRKVSSAPMPLPRVLRLTSIQADEASGSKKKAKK